MNAKLILALSVTLVIGTAAVAVWKSGEHESARPTAPAPAALGGPREPEQAASLGTVGATETVRREVPETSSAPAAESATPSAGAASESYVFQGRVLDAGGRPAPGIVVRLDGEAGTEATSDSAGWFEIETNARRGSVVAAREELVSVFDGAWNVQSGLVPICIVAPAIRLAGSVVEDSGGTLSGARVRYELPPAFETRFEANLESSSRASFGWLVPKGDLRLEASSDRIVPTSYSLTGPEDAANVVITVNARYHVDVRLSAPVDRAVRIGFADRDGSRLDVLVIKEGTTNAYTSVPLYEGRSGVVSVSSEAAELILMGPGEEPVERVPLALVPGEVNVLEP